ncbi:peroxiredoxin-4 isoform 2-T2 [Chlamydotis macqueenii]
MEAVRRRLRAGGGARARRSALLLLLAAALALGVEAEAEEPRPARPRGDEQCHYYAGGQVYPGEAARLPVSDHSLHLSQAKISKPAPYWEGTAVINGEFKELKLTDYEGKYLVFFFYPLDFTFVCPTEIIAFSDRIEEFRAINTEVVACSVDSKFTHLAWINTPRKQGGLGPMKIPLLSDLTHQISKDYGVYLEDQGHTLRGLFIIDDKRILRQITMNDLPVGRSVDETLRLVQAFQYTDKHGEVCPAGWKPGSETIKPEEAMRVWWPREEL